VKRSAALTPLSREHQHALALALALTRATDDDAAGLSRRAAAFWQDESGPHFEQEETVLLPVLARHAGDDDTDISRVQAEHADLRGRFARLAASAGRPADLHELGRRLTDHVRFEERELFPRIESLLGEEELARVGRLLSAS